MVGWGLGIKDSTLSQKVFLLFTVLCGKRLCNKHVGSFADQGTPCHSLRRFNFLSFHWLAVCVVVSSPDGRKRSEESNEGLK